MILSTLPFSDLFPYGDGQFQKFVCISFCDSTQIDAGEI